CGLQHSHPQEATGRGVRSPGHIVSRSKYSRRTTPYHALCCAPWCFPILRIDRFDRGFRVAANHRHFHSLLTRFKGEELVVTWFHTLPNQARRVRNRALAWFSHNRNRRRNLTLHKQARAVRPNNLNILTRTLYLPHRPHRRVTLNRQLMLTLHRRISQKDREKRERVRAHNLITSTQNRQILDPCLRVRVHISLSKQANHQVGGIISHRVLTGIRASIRLRKQGGLRPVNHLVISIQHPHIQTHMPNRWPSNKRYCCFHGHHITRHHTDQPGREKPAMTLPSTPLHQTVLRRQPRSIRPTILKPRIRPPINRLPRISSNQRLHRRSNTLSNNPLRTTPPRAKKLRRNTNPVIRASNLIQVL